MTSVYHFTISNFVQVVIIKARRFFITPLSLLTLSGEIRLIIARGIILGNR